MNRLARTLLTCSLLLGSAAIAADDAKITVQFSGKLKDGLREIAAKGGINLVVTGSLEQPAEVYLQGVSAEEALDTVATSYHLKVQRKGSIWTLRPMTDEEKEEQAEAKEAESNPDLPAPPMPGSFAMPPRPPTPPMPPHPEHDGEDADGEKFKLTFNRGDGVVGTGPVVVNEGQTVDDAVAYGGSVTLKPGSTVEGDAVAFGGDVILEEGSTIEGDAVSFGGKIRKRPGARVEGEEVSMGGGLGAMIARGATRHHRNNDGADGKDSEEVASSRKESASSSSGSGIVASFLAQFAALFALGFIFLVLAPARMKLIEGEVARDPVKNGLTGLLGFLAMVPLTLLLAVTIVGIPVAILLWLIPLPLAALMGFTAAANQLGLRLPVLRSRKSQAVVLALGLLPLLIIGKIPVLGPLVLFLVTCIGLGAIIRSRFGQRPKGFPEPDPTLAEVSPVS